jgi:hypothetical protein
MQLFELHEELTFWRAAGKAVARAGIGLTKGKELPRMEIEK